jgi:hypothetical protein
VSAEVVSARIGSRTLAGGPSGWGFVFHAPAEEGIEISITVRSAGPVTFRAMDGSDDLSALPGFQPRPPGVGVLGSHSSELVAVAKTYTL